MRYFLRMATLEQVMKDAEALSAADREILAVHLFATLEEDREPGYEEALFAVSRMTRSSALLWRTRRGGRDTGVTACRPHDC